MFSDVAKHNLTPVLACGLGLRGLGFIGFRILGSRVDRLANQSLNQAQKSEKQESSSSKLRKMRFESLYSV